MKKKIIIILKIILRSKFIFKTPSQNELIVFDKMSIYDLSLSLDKINFFTLETRIESIKQVYLSYKILKKIFKNFSKGNLFTVYLVSLIEIIKPKVVITSIDNSFKFSQVAKILEKKTNFIAIQNATRIDYLEWDYYYKKKKLKKNYLENLYIPNLLCHGEYEKEVFTKLNIKIKNFYPIGNLRLANAIFNIKKDKSILNEKISYDICLIAEYTVPRTHRVLKESILHSIVMQNSDVEPGYYNVAKYTIKFCKKHNLKLAIPLKRDVKNNHEMHKVEIDFFKKNLSKDDYDYAEKCFIEKKEKKFTSFRTIMDSKVAIGVTTSLLRDKIALGGKILACNLTKLELNDFPISGICKLKDFSYEEFEKRLLEIYSISKESYFSKIDKDRNYVGKYDENYSSIDLVREKLSHFGVSKNY